MAVSSRKSPGAAPAIREANDADFSAIWPIFHAVVAHGDTYAYAPTTTLEEARALWCGSAWRVFVAVSEGRVVGTYHLGANQPGLGDHVANAGFMVDPADRGRGIASAMCEHALATARASGFRAMQFNFVVSTNAPALALWKRHGFQIVGRIPQAFRRAGGDPVDVFVMHRFL